MSDRSKKREGGFSLLEMTVSVAVGSVLLAAATQVYTKGVSAAWVTTQRAEMQQDFRAASNIMTRDLSLAGAGLNPGAAFTLPSASTPVYGCDQTPKCYINGTSVPYPKQGATPYLYGLLPGYNDGPTLLAAQGPTDAVTVVYTDTNFFLDCYTATVTSTTTVTFTLPGATSGNCTAPGGNAGAQTVNNSANGLVAGDLLWLSLGSTNVIAEVTSPATAGGVATFAAADVLGFNQASGVAYSLANQFSTGNTTGYAVRIFVITYYIDTTKAQPRLMQQVSGHTPVPIAENVVYLKLTYNLFNDATDTPAIGCSNPGAASDGCSGASTGLLPNQITQTNIQNMAMDSTIQSGMFGLANGYQRIDLQTSVCARNLTFVNNYPN